MNINVDIFTQPVKVEIDSGVVSSGPQGPQGIPGPPAGVNFGLWDADTNTPTILNGIGSEGNWYTVSVPGATVLNGSGPWFRNDQVLFKGGVWTRVASQVSDAGANKGEWDAEVNDPVIVSGVGTEGEFYTVTVSGETEIDGIDLWTVGDQIIFKSGVWTRLAAPLLAIDGSNLSAPTLLAPSGALALRQSQNLFFVTPEDFGGKADDPTFDNATAIARAETFLAALPYRGELRFADGRDYYFKSTLNMNRPAGVWRGSLTRLIYNGTSTTVDLVVFGATGAINTATELKDALMQGFQILSVTKMTAGTALRARKTIECHFAEVELQTQRGFETLGNNLWNGFWLEWGATVSISGIAYVCQGEAIRVNGAPTGYSGGKSDLFINVNKVSGAQVGLHLGGAFGGVYCSPHTTFIANTVHMIENNSINNVEFAWGAEANREFFAEGSVFDFTASAPDYAAGTGGPNIIIEGPGECLFTFSGCWIAGGYGANVWVRATSAAKVNLTGCRFFIANPGNASYPAASALEGHSLAVGGTGAFVNVTGGSMHAYTKYGIYAASNGHGVTWNGVLIYSGEVGSEPVFRTPTTNAIGDYGNIRARTVESLGDTILRGALFVGTAQQSFYTTANTRYHEFNANAFISYNTTDPQYQFALSGTADAMNLHPGGLSLLGQPHIAFKYVSGTTDGSGVGSAVHGIASLPARVVIAQAHVTEAGGDTKPFQMNTDGTNVGFTGATASRPWKGWIVYLRDAV